jgi:hypothetical protein
LHLIAAFESADFDKCDGGGLCQRLLDRGADPNIQDEVNTFDGEFSSKGRAIAGPPSKFPVTE